MPLPEDVPHLHAFLENVTEATRLLDIHQALGGLNRGKRIGVEVLNKSAIILVVACWESFVEDLVKISLEQMLVGAKDHKAFPKNVLERVSQKIRESTHGIWLVMDEKKP